jgi:hypothetical protein
VGALGGQQFKIVFGVKNGKLRWFWHGLVSGTSPEGTVPSAHHLGNVTKDQAPRGFRNPTKPNHLHSATHYSADCHPERSKGPAFLLSPEFLLANTPAPFN